jgi:hypothetical protein
LTNIQGIEHGAYDFLWSSCALEHLGSLDAGLDFVVNAMDLLKPGGTAIHTTEFNLSSDDETLTSGPCVIYRRRDIDDPWSAWVDSHCTTLAAAIRHNLSPLRLDLRMPASRALRR